MRTIGLLIAIILSLNTNAQIENETSIDVGRYYFYTPYSYGEQNSYTIGNGFNFNKQYYIGAGVNFNKPYYNEYSYTGLFLEARKMFHIENVSPVISVRYGFDNYFNPAVGIIEHKDKIDLYFLFSFKRHEHDELRWVEGFEMKLGIIL